MAQTKKKRRRKHRGTQAGTVHRSPGTTGSRSSRSSGSSGSSVKTTAAQRRAERLDRPPSWRSAFNRSLAAAAIFGLLVILVFKQPVVDGVSLAAVMVLVYLPMSFYTDKFIYSRRQRSKRKAAAGK